MPDKLTDLRDQINHLDEQLLQLLNERAAVALRIGGLKSQTNTEVYDPIRERQVMKRLEELNSGPLDKGAIDEIFVAIITACREIQNR